MKVQQSRPASHPRAAIKTKNRLWAAEKSFDGLTDTRLTCDKRKESVTRSYKALQGVTRAFTCILVALTLRGVSLQKTTSAQFDCKLDRLIGPNVSSFVLVSFVELEIKLPYFGNTMKYTDFSGIQRILRYVMYNGYITI